MWTVLLPEKFPGTIKVKLVGSDIGWDMLQAGLDLARVKARNEKQEGVKLFLINFALGYSPQNAIPQETAWRKSIKKTNSSCLGATKMYRVEEILLRANQICSQETAKWILAMSLIFCTMIYTWELLTKLSCWFSWQTVAVSYQL